MFPAHNFTHYPQIILRPDFDWYQTWIFRNELDSSILKPHPSTAGAREGALPWVGLPQNLQFIHIHMIIKYYFLVWGVESWVEAAPLSFS
jgi:hypothetical protein